MYQIVLGEAEIKDAVVRNNNGRFSVLATNHVLVGAKVGLVRGIAREVRLKSTLRVAENDYNFTLIDCPPSLILLILNGLVAADGVVVLTLYGYYALEGISGLIVTVRKIRQTIDPSLGVLDIVRTMYDARSRLVAEVSNQPRQHFGDLLFNTTIPCNVRLAEAPSHGIPALTCDVSAEGVRAYLGLADELLGWLNRPA